MPEILTDRQSAPSPVRWRIAAPTSLVRSGNAAADALREAAARLDRARQEGFAQGVASAHQEAERELLPSIQNLAAFVSELARMRDILREQAAEDLVRLALAMAARVIHRDITVDPEALAGLLQAAFARRRARESCRVNVHPGFEPILRGCLERSGAPASLTLVANAAVRPGELVFEIVDAAPETPAEADLSEIERGLIDKLEK